MQDDIFAERYRKLAMAKRMREIPRASRFGPAPPQKRAVLTEHHKFATLAHTGIVSGDERATNTPKHSRRVCVDIGNADPTGFKGLYDPEVSTKRVHTPHTPVLAEYDTRYYDGVPYYWRAADRVWSTKPPRG